MTFRRGTGELPRDRKNERFTAGFTSSNERTYVSAFIRARVSNVRPRYSFRGQHLAVHTYVGTYRVGIRQRQAKNLPQRLHIVSDVGANLKGKHGRHASSSDKLVKDETRNPEYLSRSPYDSLS